MVEVLAKLKDDSFIKKSLKSVSSRYLKSFFITYDINNQL